MKRDLDLSAEYVVHGSLGMTRGSVLRIEDGRDMVIYVWEGGIWLTQEGDRRDRYLGAGECFRIERGGATIAQATAHSSVSLTAPRPQRYAKRVALSQAGTAIPVELSPAPEEAHAFWMRLFAPKARPTTAAL